MNLNLQKFRSIPINLPKLALVMMETLPRYGITFQSSNLGTVATTGLSTDVTKEN